MGDNSTIELLAPAGSPQGFYGAVSAGADAVYLGGSRFGARAYAENFTQEELVGCIKYGRLFDVKVYLTVNTLLKEQELEELVEYLEPYYRAGLHGVIIQDLGVLRVIRENFPGLELHASTQMTVCNAHGAELLKEMGICRIVPARELSLDELISLKRDTGLALETFIHGAMCYCYSGQCLFSSILGGRSGNRGRCAQPCRLPYTVKGREACYPLSLKDMCTVDHIPAFIEAGIDSFKIEGRMKKPEYAAGVTAIYRKYIDSYEKLRQSLGPQEAAKSYRVSDEDRQLLASLYIRSKLQDGYYFRHNGREMVTLDSPAYSTTEEELLAQIRDKYLREKSRLPVEVEAVFLTGQPAAVTLRSGKTVAQAVGEPVQAAQKQPVTRENLQKQLGKLGDSPFFAEKMQIQLGENVFYPLKQINELRREAAQSLEQALLAEDEEKRPNWSMQNRGNRPFQSMSCRTSTENSLNLGKNGNLSSRGQAGKDALEAGTDRVKLSWAVSVRTLEQLEILVEFHAKSPDFVLKRIYIDGDLLARHSKEVLTFCHYMAQPQDGNASVSGNTCANGNTCVDINTDIGGDACELMPALPYILREADEEYLHHICKLAEEGPFSGILVRSFDGLGFLTRHLRSRSGRKPLSLRGDAGLYVWNSQTAVELAGLLDGFCIPLELKLSEQRALLARTEELDWEKLVYGRIPMMITANCVQRTMERCRKGQAGVLTLTDRYRKEFPVLPNCLHCTNIIYNSVPLALSRKAGHLPGIGQLRMDFTLETAKETETILRSFHQGESLPEGTYTTGHEKRGVE